MTNKYENFQFSEVPPGTKWFGVDIANLPIMYLPTGAICEPFIRYFANGWRKRMFKTAKSMNPEKYALRDWFARCHEKRLHWLDADDDELSAFRDEHAADIVAGRISAKQVEVKLGFIFKFYRSIPDAMPFQSHGRFMRCFVGEPEQQLTPITSKLAEGPGGPTLVWSRSVTQENSGTKRPTPNQDQVERILEHLRFKVKELRAKRTTGWAANLRRLEGERNWLIARCEAEAGLRRFETAALNLRDLCRALAEERLLDGVGVRDYDAAVQMVVAAADNQELREGILERISKYRIRGHETLYVTMARKWRKIAAVQFPLGLIEDILTIGIWTVRHAIVDHWHLKDSNYTSPLEIFLSSRNGLRLSDGAVGDIVNDAFAELEISGSGHRLRAYFLTHMAWLIWNENFALGGYRFDVAVVTMTLDRLTELAGHSEPSTLEQHYLDMALLRHFSSSNRSRMSAMSELMNALIYAGPLLANTSVKILRNVIYKLSDDSQPHFPYMLEALLEEFPSSSPPQNPKPNLKVVK